MPRNEAHAPAQFFNTGSLSSACYCVRHQPPQVQSSSPHRCMKSLSPHRSTGGTISRAGKLLCTVQHYCPSHSFGLSTLQFSWWRHFNSNPKQQQIAPLKLHVKLNSGGGKQRPIAKIAIRQMAMSTWLTPEFGQRALTRHVPYDADNR